MKKWLYRYKFKYLRCFLLLKIKWLLEFCFIWFFDLIFIGGGGGCFYIVVEFILFKNDICVFELLVGKEILKVVKKDDLNIEKDIVIKIGRIMGKIKGCFMDDSFIVKVDRLFLLRGYFVFFNCYVIEDIFDD